MKAKLFVLSFCVLSVIGLGCVSLVNYIVDPFFQYRVKDGQYILNPRFVNPGLIKNYDYNMLLIGSSMTQLIDVPALAKGFDANLLRVSSGDMNPKEIELMYSLAKMDNVDRFIINLDLLSFNYEEEPVRYPEFSYKTDILSKLKYLINYETSRLTIVDIITTHYVRTHDQIPSILRDKIMIGKIGDYSEEIKLNKAAVIYDYELHFWQKGENIIYERMTDRFDNFLSNLQLEKYPEKEYIFFLPPYSIVYWYAAKERGYYETLRRFVSYIIHKTDGYPNVRFVCMYDADFVTELDTFSDMLHYGPMRKQNITDAFLGNGVDFSLSVENLNSRLQHLDEILTEFEKTDWKN